jgi:prepilin-type N-terminal cleavage/methylation domain-containing protein
MDKKSLRGFTLIELLVVIAIIGILSSIAMIYYGNVRKQARDVRVKQEFRQLEAALKTYQSYYGVYPCGKVSQTDFSTDISSTGDFLRGPVSGLGDACDTTGDLPIYRLEKDSLINAGLDHPHGGGNPYTYVYEVSQDRKSYVLYTLLESDTAAMDNDGGLCPKLFEEGDDITSDSLPRDDALTLSLMNNACGNGGGAEEIPGGGMQP